MRGLTRPAHLSFVAGAAGPAMSFRPPDLLRGNPMDFGNIRGTDRVARIMTGISLTGASFLLPGPFSGVAGSMCGLASSPGADHAV